jgi:hypothetical protein
MLKLYTKITPLLSDVVARHVLSLSSTGRVSLHHAPLPQMRLDCERQAKLTPIVSQRLRMLITFGIGIETRIILMVP